MRPYILSASRRMDVPAFQLPAFLRHAEGGVLSRPNPFSGKEESVVLTGPHVAGIVFWTRRPAALLPEMPRIRRLWGDRLRVQFSLTGMPRSLEPHSPEADEVVAAVGALARQLAPTHLIWRYDPILLSAHSPASWWVAQFRRLAPRLVPLVDHAVISWLDLHARTRRNLTAGPAPGWLNPSATERAELLAELREIAQELGMTLKSCCEPELQAWGLESACCLDGAWFEQRLGLLPGALASRPSRPGCTCSINRDVGLYNQCAFGCRYCYANARPQKVVVDDPWEKAPGLPDEALEIRSV